MAGNTFGTVFRATTFGESHGSAVGAVVDGCPAGVALGEADIQRALDRRKPGDAGNASVTARKEPDAVRMLSGVCGGVTTGAPIALLIENTAQHSADYDSLKNTFRPGHADFTYREKYGFRDHRGGGRSSGRETAARVAAGAVAGAVLRAHAISITAYTVRAAGISVEKKDFSVIDGNPLRACDTEAARKMNEKITALRAIGDSAGGIVECTVRGVPAGWGEPVFDKLDAELAKAMVSIGAIKGVEFGDGFAASDLTGSENNDPLCVEDGAARFLSNHAGGILGGISNGGDIVFRVAVKPVPSIFTAQQTVETSDEGYRRRELTIHGRHDVCLCPRIVPVVEAMTALTLADFLLRQRSARI